MGFFSCSIDVAALRWAAVAISHEELSTEKTLEEVRGATTSELMISLTDTHAKGLPFDEKVVFELATRAVMAERTHSGSVSRERSLRRLDVGRRLLGLLVERV